MLAGKPASSYEGPKMYYGILHRTKLTWKQSTVIATGKSIQPNGMFEESCALQKELHFYQYNTVYFFIMSLTENVAGE